MTDPRTIKSFYVKHHINVIIIAVGVEKEATVKTLAGLASKPEYFINAGSDSQAITEAMSQGFSLAEQGNLEEAGNVTMESL